MNFVPRKIAEESCKRLLDEHLSRSRKKAMERRKAYLKAKEEGKLDEYFNNAKLS